MAWNKATFPSLGRLELFCLYEDKKPGAKLMAGDSQISGAGFTSTGRTNGSCPGQRHGAAERAKQDDGEKSHYQ